MDTIVVRRLAEAELAEAKAWYELKSEGLGNRFIDEFRHAAVAIAEAPLRWPKYYKQIRRYLMTTFPYVIYYEVRPEKIRILRVVHAARDPGGIKSLLA